MEERNSKFKFYYYLEILHYIKEEAYGTLITYIQHDFKGLIDSFKDKAKEEIYIKIRDYIICLIFFKHIRIKEYSKAYEILGNTKINNNNTILLYNELGEIKHFSFSFLSSLLCYENPLESNISYLLLDKQKELISNQINSLILNIAGLEPYSLLETIIKHNSLVCEVKRYYLQYNDSTF